MGTYTKAYRATGVDNRGVTGSTPREAARKFFEANPTKRKCNITEGMTDGHFFQVAFSLRADGRKPERWKDVTKKTAETLPDRS